MKTRWIFARTRMGLLASLVLVLTAGCYSTVHFTSRNPTETTSPVRVSGRLYRPIGPGRFPAVVLLHGSDGVHPYHYRWAEWFMVENYVALVVDSVDARGRTGERVWDAFGALAYLRSLPFVDAARVGAVGWSAGAGVAMLAGGELFMTRAPDPGSFGAVVAFYPPCSLSDGIKMPVLFLLGGADTWTPAERCIHVGQAVKKESVPAEWVVYPGATHGFDFNRGWWDGSSINIGGQVLRYDARATADAETRIRDFLARYLRRAP